MMSYLIIFHDWLAINKDHGLHRPRVTAESETLLVWFCSSVRQHCHHISHTQGTVPPAVVRSAGVGSCAPAPERRFAHTVPRHPATSTAEKQHYSNHVWPLWGLLQVVAASRSSSPGPVNGQHCSSFSRNSWSSLNALREGPNSTAGPTSSWKPSEHCAYFSSFTSTTRHPRALPWPCSNPTQKWP